MSTEYDEQPRRGERFNSASRVNDRAPQAMVDAEMLIMQTGVLKPGTETQVELLIPEIAQTRFLLQEVDEQIAAKAAEGVEMFQLDALSTNLIHLEHRLREQERSYDALFTVPPPDARLKRRTEQRNPSTGAIRGAGPDKKGKFASLSRVNPYALTNRARRPQIEHAPVAGPSRMPMEDEPMNGVEQLPAPQHRQLELTSNRPAFTSIPSPFIKYNVPVAPATIISQVESINDSVTDTAPLETPRSPREGQFMSEDVEMEPFNPFESLLTHETAESENGIDARNAYYAILRPIYPLSPRLERDFRRQRHATRYDREFWAKDQWERGTYEGAKIPVDQLD